MNTTLTLLLNMFALFLICVWLLYTRTASLLPWKSSLACLGMLLYSFLPCDWVCILKEIMKCGATPRPKT